VKDYKKREEEEERKKKNSDFSFGSSGEFHSSLLPTLFGREL